MIEHYSLYTTGELSDRFSLDEGVPKGVKPRYNVTPTQLAHVVVSNDAGNILRPMAWGLVSAGAKDMNSVFRYKTFNTRSEKVFAKASWSKAIKQQRCIIPANGFYMIRSGTSDAYYFTHPSQSVMGLAGLYSSWTDRDGNENNSYSLLTIEAGNAMPLPFPTMPVLLHAEDEKDWLNKDVTDFSPIVRMMRPYEAGLLRYVKVASDVPSSKADSSSLILPIDA